jgi:membrane protease subunit HflK
MAIDHHGHDHGERREHPGDQFVGRPGDPAGQSLTDALRVSFGLLTLIMLVVVAAFMLSGLATVRAHEKGVIRIFGRIVGAVDQGLAYTWPFPIGSIEKVPKTRQELSVEEFWMYESPEDRTVKLHQRAARGQGLRPIWDGALLTGDRNLLHMKLVCVYEISDPEKHKKCFADPAEAVRSILCGAVNRAAAVETAEGLMLSQRITEFRRNVLRIAQEQLDRVDSGINILEIQTPDTTWPLRALSDFKEVSKAVGEKERKINEAKGEAQGILWNVAGAASVRLIGTLEQVLAGSPEASKEGENLIGRYIRTRSDLDEAARAYEPAKKAGKADQEKRQLARVTELTRQAEDLLDRINEVLVSSETEGQASGIIRQAATYRDATIQRLESWHRTFLDLARECTTRRATAFLFQRKWAEAREEILGSPTIEKYTLPPSKEKMILNIPRDPVIAKQILRESLKQPEEQSKGKEGGQ